MSSSKYGKYELPSNWESVPPNSSTYRTARSKQDVATNSSPYSANQYPDPIGVEDLSIAVISPSEESRQEAVQAMSGCTGAYVSEFSSYSLGTGDLPSTLDEDNDVILIDLDGDAEFALELVESICANGVATVMVYSESSDPELLVRCMRAGAREFLTLPFAPDVVADALVRAAARRPATRPSRKPAGRLFAFMGSKGGAGTTMLACNFAVALAKESGERTLLIDLDLPLGDAALNLGIAAEFSAIDALAAGGQAGCEVSGAASGRSTARASGCWRRRDGLSSSRPTTKASTVSCRWRATSSTTWLWILDRGWN